MARDKTADISYRRDLVSPEACNLLACCYPRTMYVYITTKVWCDVTA